jgi:hypothetical protein
MNIVILGAGTAGLIAALMLREKYPFYNITIVKSGDIGIVGVGEGSTEHWRKFMNFVGINHAELIAETGATIKIGILFKNWSIHGDYTHSVDEFAVISPLNRLDNFLFSYSVNQLNNNYIISQYFDHLYLKNKTVFSLEPSNQYHFDTFKLNTYLNLKCSERNIHIVDAIVNDVELNESGDAVKLICDNQTFDADFFIDCSGFRRVISKKQEVKWLSMGKYLPMNHAIAFPTEHDDPNQIEPYTTATALSSGWAWKIPTQERYGNGYVFCDSYINSDQALQEMNVHLNKNVEKFARDIKFEAGRIDKFWNKNVLSVGLAGSFAEPLEAQSIGFTIVQMFHFLDHIEYWKCNKNAENIYNNLMNDSFENTISYLQAHYLGEKTDSEFWKNRSFELTDFNKENLDQMKAGHILPCMFNYNHQMFAAPNWFQVLSGLKLIDKNKVAEILASNREGYNNALNGNLIQYYNKVNDTIGINHRELLNILVSNYNERKNRETKFG